MAEWSKIDYLLAQNDDEVLHVGKDGTRYNGGTFSPWIGCDKGDRAGCAHCWAEMWARRNTRFRGHWGRNAPRYFFGEEHWQQPLRWQRKCERLGVRKRVLVSLCDPFEGLPFAHHQGARLAEERRRLWDLVAATPMLDWLVLTKRPERMGPGNLPAEPGTLGKHGRPVTRVLPNLWLGVSAWDQPSADRNIPLLLEVPAALHWVSFEPLLGPVDAARWLLRHAVDEVGQCAPWCRACGPSGPLPSLGWVVVGCESRGARPGRRCDREWVHSLAGQCRRANVPLFTKQLPDALSGRQLVKSTQLAGEGWPVQMPGRSS